MFGKKKASNEKTKGAGKKIFMDLAETAAAAVSM